MGVINIAPTQLLDKAIEGQLDHCFKDQNCIADTQIPFGRFVEIEVTSTDDNNPHVKAVSATTTVDTLFGVSGIAAHEVEQGRSTETVPGLFPAYAAEDACTIQKEAYVWLYSTTAFAPNDQVFVIIDGAANADELGRIRNSADGTNTLALDRQVARVSRASTAGEMVRVSLAMN